MTLCGSYYAYLIHFFFYLLPLSLYFSLSPSLFLFLSLSISLSYFLSLLLSLCLSFSLSLFLSLYISHSLSLTFSLSYLWLELHQAYVTERNSPKTFVGTQKTWHQGPLLTLTLTLTLSSSLTTSTWSFSAAFSRPVLPSWYQYQYQYDYWRIINIVR